MLNEVLQRDIMAKPAKRVRLCDALINQQLTKCTIKKQLHMKFVLFQKYLLLCESILILIFIFINKCHVNLFD